jgi:ligand-binding sensor domain-containing protein
MRNTSALHWTLLVALLASPVGASAQSATDDQEPVASPPSPTITTIAQSEQIGEYVRGVFQDRDGNHWFRTSNAVCRYDGKSLTYFTKSGLQILQDENGAMWFAGTVDAVSRYEDGKFTNYTVANGLSHNRVWSMMMDSAGTIWVGTNGGVCRFEGESFVPFPIPRAEVENPYSNISPLLAFGMAEDQDGNLWFGMDGEGVRKFDGESFTTYTTKDGLVSNNVRSVYADRRGRMWFGTAKGGVSCYDGTAFREDHGLTISGLPAHAHVQDMFEDRDGILWFGCSDGLWRLDGESFINVTKNGPWPVPHKKIPRRAQDITS